MIYGIEKPEPDDDFAVAIAFWSTKEKSFMVTIMNPHITLSASFLKIDDRASSAIQPFDKEKMIIETSSGRLYKLHGRPSSHTDARYI